MKWQRAVLVWVIIAVAESAHGTIRRFFLVPLIGERPASQLGVLVGSAIIFAITWFSIHWLRAGSKRHQLQVGILWVLLTVIFEFGFGHLLGYSAERILSDYNVAEGGLMGFGLLFMLMAPALVARARGVRGYLF